MILNRLGLVRFATKKVVGQPGIILEPEAFRKNGFLPKVMHWFRNVQTFNDMERHMKDFNRSKSHASFIQLNNKIINLVEKRNFNDI